MVHGHGMMMEMMEMMDMAMMRMPTISHASTSAFE